MLINHHFSCRVIKCFDHRSRAILTIKYLHLTKPRDKIQAMSDEEDFLSEESYEFEFEDDDDADVQEDNVTEQDSIVC